MPKQFEIPGISSLRIQPEAGRTEPRLWVRRLVVWSAPGVILREVSLRPGLNIIWSPDPGDPVSTTGISGSLGHGSGKTLFCRLLRYCLGEDHFAPDEQRDRIGDAFPEGQVGAEIVLDGTSWAILRSIGKGRQHFAIPGGDLNLLAADPTGSHGMEPFLKAIEDGLLSANVAGLMPGTRALRAWPIALAWLSRDQECRFNHPLEWRSSESDSGSPARSLSKETSLDALRALVGAIVPEEHHLRAEINRLVSIQQEICLDADHRKWEAEQLRARLAVELHLRIEDHSTGSMGVVQLRQAAKVELARLASVDPSTDVADLDNLRAGYEEARTLVDVLAREQAVLESRIPEIRNTTRLIRNELTAHSFSTDKSENPLCPVCEVPVDRVLAEGCKLSHKLPDLEKMRTRLNSLKGEYDQERQRLEDAIRTENLIRENLALARRQANEIVDRLRAVENLRDDRAEAWFGARRLIADADRLDGLLFEQETMQSKADQKDGEIKVAREQERAFRDTHSIVFHRLSEKFDAIIHEIVGHDAKGKISFDGNGLKLGVEMGGDRSTAAIDSLKVIVFDLAVLCTSIEGRTHLPAFLVHDSPREADLGLSVYHQLFRFARTLEQVGNQPLFQYIVMTTTRPPEELSIDPWLRETLGGSPAEARLLKKDL